MNKDLLFSMQGSVLLGIEASVILEQLTLLDLVRAKKAVASGEQNINYDFNLNGIVDGEDINTLAQLLVNN